MGAVPADPGPLTDIEYKLLLVAYIHSKPEGSMNKGKVISFLFAAAGPVGNNPASMAHLLAEFAVESVGELEIEVNGFALSARRNLLAALKQTRTSVLNALPPDFPAGSKEDADVHVRPILASVAKKVQALQEFARAQPEPAAVPATGGEAAAQPPPRPVQVRAMIWQPPIPFTRTAKLGGADSKQMKLTTPFDGDLVLGAGALLYRLRVEGDAVRIQHYEMYGEHRPAEDAVFPLGRSFVIGRGVKADHRRPDQNADMGSRGLSRVHVAVTIGPSQPKGTLTAVLEDLGSTNGTPVWWNGPQGAPPVPTEHRETLERSASQQSLDVAFDGDAWIAAGSLLCRLVVQGGIVNVVHHGVDPAKVVGEQYHEHPVGTPFTIGRDTVVEHPVPDDHPGAVGLSRRHVTVQVSEVGGNMRLDVSDHSSNGTTVWWNSPRGGAAAE